MMNSNQLFFIVTLAFWHVFMICFITETTSINDINDKCHSICITACSHIIFTILDHVIATCMDAWLVHVHS